MGEYSEMILDGTMCQECGVFITEIGDGCPRECEDCKQEHEDESN